MNTLLKVFLTVFATSKMASSTDLQDAIREGRKEDVENILSECTDPSVINRCEKKDDPKPLTSVMCKPISWEDVAITMVRKGADLTYRASSEAFTPLHLAALFGWPRLVKAMLERKSDLDLEAATKSGYTPFLTAVKNDGGCHLPFVNFGEGATNVPENDTIDIIQQMIDAGANIEAKIETTTALHFSAITGNQFLANVLLAKGANANAKCTINNVIYAPLDLVLRYKRRRSYRRNCLIAYVNYGADMTFYVAGKILKIISRAALKMVNSKIFRSLDDCVMQLTAELTKVPKGSLRDTAVAYDEQAAFVLYRLLKILKRDVKFPDTNPSELENRLQSISEYVYGVADGSKKIVAPPRWEMFRWSYNLALASISVDSDVEYAKLASIELIFRKPIPSIIRKPSRDDFHYSLNWYK